VIIANELEGWLTGRVEEELDLASTDGDEVGNYLAIGLAVLVIINF
jgi:hypothetical protein